jgi:hypothetical protein
MARDETQPFSRASWQDRVWASQVAAKEKGRHFAGPLSVQACRALPTAASFRLLLDSSSWFIVVVIDQMTVRSEQVPNPS